MRPDNTPLRLPMPVLLIVFLCINCQGTCTNHQESIQEAASPTNPPQQQGDAAPATDNTTNTSAMARWIARNQDVDRANRYLSAALVSTNATMTEGGAVDCSGALIAPRLVLTAATCVCMKTPAHTATQKNATQADASNCAKQSSVFFINYDDPPAQEQPYRSVSTEYWGDVRPHPDFKMIFSESGELISSNANLAVVVLASAVQDVPALRLTETPTQPGESLLLVGYPSDIEHGGIHRKRRSLKIEVVNLSTQHEDFSFSIPSRQRTDMGINGGPLLREASNGPVLIGIVNASSASHYSIISTHPYMAWLLKEIRGSENRGN
jgi:hypothetical protein